MFQENVLQEKLKIIFLQNISGRGVFHGIDFSSKFTDSWSILTDPWLILQDIRRVVYNNRTV